MSEALKSDYKFKPIRGLEADLLGDDEGHAGVPHTEGALLIATDTGRMWLDTPNNRVALGGSGASLLYGKATATQLSDADGNYYYLLDKTELEDPDVKAQVDDLVLNTDGAFYRITSIDGDDLYCSRLAVSGSGSGTGGSTTGTKAMTFKGKSLSTVTLVNGQSMSASLTATSALDENGDPLDDDLTISWSISVTATGIVYDSGTFKVQSGVQKDFEFGSRLRESTGSTLTMYATGVNSGKSKTLTYEVTTVELLLYASEKFSNLSPQSSTFTVYCNVSGNIEKILKFYLDGDEVGTKTLGKTVTGEQSYTLSNVSHGYHTLEINLFQSIDGEVGVGVNEPLTMEIAVNAGGTDPIIWIGDYATEYYNYDAIKIPYRVFDPSKEEVTVEFLKGITQIGERTESSSSTAFSYWQITDASMATINTYTIQVAKSTVEEGDSKYVQRKVSFEVVQDPNRDLSLVSQENLMLKFDAAGRSNSDTEAVRESWSYVDSTSGSAKTYTGEFEGFNWYNNGWKLDDNNDTCLRISNGAKFAINIGNMVLNNPNSAAQQSRTFEFEFKIKNVQDYSNLIKEYTRYSGDSTYWDSFLLQKDSDGGYTNYDNYLRYILSLDGATTTYDELTADGKFNGITRLVASNNPFCSYYDASGHGFLLGPQDGFFSSAQNKLNVKYVEDKLINLSIVFNYTDQRMYMYLQGILTAVGKLTDTNALTISADQIIFSSDYCDVDLYKFRIYNGALSVRDILINYSVDHTSVLDYDHTTQLISYNEDTHEYQLNYKSVAEWNSDTDNLDRLLMPYVIWDTGSKTAQLPFSKADSKSVGMTFVNTPLDRTFQTGELEELANAMSDDLKAAAEDEGLSYVQYYYKHHCPSWTSVEKLVSLAVQGTSSEFYPRRNYKAKTKDSDDNVHMFMNKGPFAEAFNSFQTKYNFAVPTLAEDKSNQDSVDEAQKLYDMIHLDWFYFNNYSVGANKFTMKIDFMESSGTYNMGLANLVHTAYTKHPVDDYNTAGAFAKTKYVKEDATATYNAKTTYYSDEKGKNKVKFDETTVYAPATYYVATYDAYTFDNTDELRTNCQGFPVMAFWKYGDTDNDYRFLGRYNYLSDKGADETYGFKPDKGLVQTFAKNKDIRKIAECWEYSDNARGFCSFKDPKNRHKLSFDLDTISIEKVQVKDGYELAEEEAPVDGVTYYSKAEDADTYTEVTFDETTVYEASKYYKDKYIEKPQIKKTHTLNSKGSCPIVADSFEYRYNTNKDFLDYIYDPVTNASTGQDLVDAGDYKATQLTDIDYRCTTMFDMYKNWEKACQWVWSTNTDNVPSEADRVAGKATARKIMDYVQVGPDTDNATFDATGATQYYDSCEDAIATANLSEDAFTLGLYYIGIPKTVTYDDTTIYEYDTKEYRTAKFVNELKDHFDLEYLLVYFVMTEVLLLYDSRGKNCMMASWGPKASGGDYIWYPVFYDMDTQLGINNTGIPSFEYSENATMDGTFSTSDSILWNNLFNNYFTDIQGKYQDLRNSVQNSRYTGDGTLYDVDHIESWYLADPDVTGEIEMRGDRPLAMFNMDEQYKYLSICNSAIKYQDKSGSMAVDDGTYFYALQGDRSLSRQQFLSRRLNFIDSWFSQGNYSRSGGTAIHGRVGANNPSLYSDCWVEDSSKETGSTFDYQGQTYTVEPYYVTNEDGSIKLDDNGYGVKTEYLDADFFVNLTPYQKSYVTIGNDNEAYGSKEYEGKEVHFELPSTNVTGIKSSPGVSESLLYIYGASALSDMGDVSTLYWSEFYAENSPHLQKILLGNDHPSFYNRNLKSPAFYAKPSDNLGGKPLLKEVNLSGLQLKTESGAITDFDFTSSEKMQIFKAIRSNITSAKFADGVALHTLYLPASITSLKLVEAANLDTVLTELNTTFDENTYTDPETNTYYSTYDPKTNTWTAKRGLYIEGVTNVTSVTPNVTSSNLAQIEIAGGNLGYGSYDILHTLYDIFRNGDKAGTKDLQISMTDVMWSPYKKLETDAVWSENAEYFTDDYHYGFTTYTHTSDDQWTLDLTNGLVYKFDRSPYMIEVAEGTSYDSSVTYYTDDGRTDFKQYGYTDEDTWNADLADEKVYTYDEDALNANLNKITDITMLKDFIERNQFKNTTSADSTSTPTLTGYIYVNNTTAVDEDWIRNTMFNGKFDSTKLDIHFANVTKGYSARFLQVEADGTIKVIGTQVVPTSRATSSRFANPYDTYEAKRDNYDFWGWSVDNTKDGVIESAAWMTDDRAAIKIAGTEGGTYDYTFYAVFTRHAFDIEFKVGTSSAGFTDACEAKAVLYGDYLSDPGIMPALDESDLDDTQRYRFLGWTQDKSAVIASSVAKAKTLNLTQIQATDNFIFYAVFVIESVYDSVLDDKYLKFNTVTYTNPFTNQNTTGYEVGLNLYNETSNPTGYLATALSGKITLPAYHDGTPVISIAGSGFANNTNITHVFFEKDNELGDCPLKRLDEYAFNACTKLKKIYLPESLEYIRQYALANDTSLELTEVSGNIQFIEGYAFHATFASITDDFYLGGNVRYLQARAFNNFNMNINTLYIGSKSEPTQLRNCGNYSYNYITNGGFIRNGDRPVQNVVVYYSSAEDKEFVADLIAKGYIDMAAGANVTYTPV